MNKPQYDNTNRGVLLKNDRKESSRHADYTGKINVEGREYWLSAWLNEGKKGKFFSLTVRQKDDEAGGTGSSTAKKSYSGDAYRAAKNGSSPPPAQDIDDDIPF